MLATCDLRIRDTRPIDPEYARLLRASLMERGVVTPIVVRAETMEVLDGRKRVRLLGPNMVIPALVVPMSDEQADVYMRTRSEAGYL